MIDVKELETLSIQDLYDIDLELERKRCLSDLWYFCVEVLEIKILNEAVHKEYIDALDNIAELEDFLIQLPRGHLKSTIIVAWIAQQIVKNPEIRIAIICSVYNLALKMMIDFKAIANNPKVRNLFPEVFWENTNIDECIWQSDRIIVRRKGKHGGYTLRVGSIDGEMTGEHYDILVFDDVQAKKNSQTALQIQGVIDGIKNFKSILEPGGYRIFVGTRWKSDDAYDWIINELNIKSVVKSCAVNSLGEECSVLEDDAQPIYPERFTIEGLRKTRAEQGAYFFSCQYENNPLPMDMVVFKESWIKYFSKPVAYKKIYILIDPALTKNKKSDESVICVVGQPFEKTAPLHVIKSTGLSFSDTKGEIQFLIDEIFNEYLFYRTQAEVVVAMETNAFQHVLKQWLDKEQKDRKIYFEITELKTLNRPKEVRVKALQPLFENHGIIFNEFNTDKIVSQLLKYGAIAHDDHPDALAYILDVLEDYSIAEIKVLPIDGDYYDMDEDLLLAVAGDKSWRDY